VFSAAGQVAKDIIAAGEKALLSLYGNANEEELNRLRYKRFCDKVANSTSYVEPLNLPPTSAAARFHSLRVYYQMMEWKGTAIDMKPEDWGWHVLDGRYLPIQTDQPAGPSELLDIICCRCKEDCSTRKCTCRKYDLPCTAVCRVCRGTCCTNSQKPDFTDELDELDMAFE